MLYTSNRPFFESNYHTLLTYAKKITVMIICAIGFLGVLMPLLRKKKYVLFVSGFFLLMFLLQMLYVAIDHYIILEMFPDEKASFISKFGEKTYWERVLNPLAIFIRVPTFYMVPSLVLLFIEYLRDQNKLAEVNEQKQKAELNALKNQLNPHFLFNTLNNIYSLAVQKSDKTPEVVSGLADMLDYMIYKTNQQFVPIEHEVKLLEDYIALEKVRYGKRVNVAFNKEIDAQVNVAPLILLTFFENAFKHGVSEELGQAEITANLKANEQEIHFQLENSIPKAKTNDNGKSLGIENVRRQLDLLYGDDYELTCKNGSNQYSVTLNLQAK